MGNRLSKIATRTGDNGTTGLGDGSRISKNSVRIHAIGEIDELNTHLGLLLCETLPDPLRHELCTIQQDLFDIGGELCIPGYTIISQRQVSYLDQLLEQYNALLTPLKDFILPGGVRSAAQAHVCRTVCRRAERSLIELCDTETIGEPLKQYLNRLSDLLFVLSRVLNQISGQPDILWDKNRKQVL